MSSEARQAASSLPYPEKYHSAVNFVETVAVGSKALKDEAQLILYGLRQQVTEGPCISAKPWGWNVVETAKWQSWHHLGNLSSMEAMRLYVRTLEEEQANWYALLQEAEQSKPEPAASTASPAQVATAAAEPASQAVLKPAVDYAKEGVWTSLPLDDQKRPLPRYEHSAGLVAGSIYVIGGNYGGRYLNDCWKLNLTTCQWSQLTLSLGGSADGDGKAASEITPAAAEGAASATAAAAAASPAPALVPLAGHQIVTYNGNLIVLGGHVKVKVKGKEPKPSLTVRVVNLAKQTVDTLNTAGAPAARGAHTASIIGDKVFVFGGEDAGRRTLGDLHVLDLSTVAWSEPTTSGPKPSPRSAHAAAVYKSRWLIIFGGGSVATCYNDVSVLDTQTMTWSVPPVAGVKVTPRAGHAGGVLGDAWYLVGGGNNVKGCTEMFSLDLTNVPSGGPLTWSSVLSIPLRDPLSSEGISILPLVNSKALVAFGGYNGKYQNSVHVFRPAAPAAAPAAANGTASEGGATPSSTPKGPKEDAVSSSTSEGGAIANGTSSSKPPPAASTTAASVVPESKTPTAAATAASPETLADVKAQLDAARKEVDAALKEVAAAKGSATHEIKLLRSQLAAAQAGQAETQKELQKSLSEARAAHQREQAKVLKLEAEAAELSRRLGGMSDLEKEVEKYRRAAREAEEAKAKAAGGGGLWGYLSGTGGGDASSTKA